eukprot:11945590-Ditylum_brightwellii.AAC.2
MKILSPSTMKKSTSISTSSVASISKQASSDTRKKMTKKNSDLLPLRKETTTGFNNQERKHYRPSSNVPPVIHLHSQEESGKKESGTLTIKTNVDDPADLTDLPASLTTESPSSLIKFKSSDNILVDTVEVSYTPELNKC